MKKVKEQADSLRSRVTAALDRTGLLSEDEDTKNRFIHLVRSVVEKSDDVEGRYSGSVPPTVLDNIAILKISFGLNNREVTSIIRGDLSQLERTLTVRESEIGMLATAYAQAKSRFPHLKDALASGKKFEEIDLRSHLALGRLVSDDPRSKPGIPLHIARALELVRWSDEFQYGNPDAICLAAEKYLAAGAIEIAEPLIEQVLEAAPDHPGGWFQKARLLLKKSAQAARQASHFRIVGEETDPFSAAEIHYEELAYDQADTSRNLRRQAFDACVKAYSLLPDKKEYERSAIRWSSDYGTLRSLRVSVGTFIVREAGERCNPYRWESGLRERIDARLGRVQKFVSRPGQEGAGPSRERVYDPNEMARLAAKPLFSDATDKVILAAYRELTVPLGFALEDRISLQLSALNFLRLLSRPEDYQREVANFAESIKAGYAPRLGEYFGPFHGPDAALTCWRLVLHEHLDVIMSRAEQRGLVRAVYAGWVSEVNRRRDEALLSIYDDEIRLRFAAGDKLGAYHAACMAEHDGIYRRDDGYGALVLTRTAQHVDREFGGGANAYPAVLGHLGDAMMRQVAESYSDAKISEWDTSDGPSPFPDHLWPPDDGAIDM